MNLIKAADGATVVFDGRLDTVAAQEITKDLDSILECTSGPIVLDCRKLTYVSSSGLRIFLTIRKAAAEKGGSVSVRGISNDIRNVFMMTGFLNLFNIED